MRHAKWDADEANEQYQAEFDTEMAELIELHDATVVAAEDFYRLVGV